MSKPKSEPGPVKAGKATAKATAVASSKARKDATASVARKASVNGRQKNEKVAAATVTLESDHAVDSYGRSGGYRAVGWLVALVAVALVVALGLDWLTTGDDGGVETEGVAGPSVDADTAEDAATAADDSTTGVADSESATSVVDDSAADDSAAEDSAAEDSAAEDSAAEDSAAGDSAAGDESADDSAADDESADDEVASDGKPATVNQAVLARSVGVAVDEVDGDNDITVKVVNSVVQLSGSTPSASEAEAVEAAAAGVDGVESVINNISVDEIEIGTAAEGSQGPEADNPSDDKADTDSSATVAAGDGELAPGSLLNEELDLGSIQFEYYSSDLSDGGRAQIERVVTYLSESEGRLEIRGHTDSSGDVDQNKRLGQRRADAVKAYLVGRGVDAGRLDAIGVGEEEPIASNDNAAGQETNRRIELITR